MHRLRTLFTAAVATAALIALQATAAAQHPTFPGAASRGGLSTPVNWIYDTGAAVTSMTPGSAAAIGLVPGMHAGVVLLNGVPAHCYPGVTITCIDSFGNVCVNTTTVYVPVAGILTTVNLLGRDIRKKFKGKWMDENETVEWGDPNTPVGPFLLMAALNDPTTGKVLYVADAIELRGSSGVTISLPMTTLSGSNRTFITAQAAIDLKARLVGQVDLRETDPTTFDSLCFAGQNDTMTTVFDEVEIDALSLGIGPDVGTLRVLVNVDGNSGFGSLGKDALQSTADGVFVIHEKEMDPTDVLVYAYTDADSYDR